MIWKKRGRFPKTHLETALQNTIYPGRFLGSTEGAVRFREAVAMRPLKLDGELMKI